MFEKQKEKRKKFINDYVTETYTDSKGREKVKVTYVGPKIYFREDKRAVQKKLIASLVCALIVAASCILMNARVHATSFSPFVVLPAAGILFPCITLIAGAFTLQLDAGEMKRDRYMHSIIRLFNSAGVIIPLSVVIFVAEMVVRANLGDWMFLAGDIVFLAGNVLSMAFSIALILVLRSIDIDEREIAE